MFYKSFFKRALDISASGVGLICASPILVIVIVWLHFANKGAGVFFFQERPGKGARIFKVVKFKTMTDEKDADGNLLSDERRLTRVGRFVRSTSLDELPQLFNVLKGDMSPLSTLNSCGSSSSEVERTKRPTRVNRRSSDNRLPSASFSSVIVLNLTTLKILAPLPGRS